LQILGKAEKACLGANAPTFSAYLSATKIKTFSTVTLGLALARQDVLVADCEAEQGNDAIGRRKSQRRRR